VLSERYFLNHYSRGKRRILKKNIPAKDRESLSFSLSLARAFLLVHLLVLLSSSERDDCFVLRTFARARADSLFFFFFPFLAFVGIFDANTHFTEAKQQNAANSNALNVPRMLRKCAKSKRLLDAMENGVFDALKRGYLRSVALVISHPDDPKTLLEEYLFTVEYDQAKRARLLTTSVKGKETASKDGAKKKNDEERLTDPKRIRKNAIATTRTLLSLVRTLDALPDGSTANLNLTYTEETPATYEPPFFEAADDAAVDEENDFGEILSKEEFHDGSKMWKRDPFTMELGCIETKYHSMKVKASSALDPLLDGEEEEEEEEEERNELVELQVEPVQKPAPATTVEKEKSRKQSPRYPDREAMRIHGGVDPNANAVPESQLASLPPVEKKKRGRSPEKVKAAEPLPSKKRGRPPKVSNEHSQPRKKKKAKKTASTTKKRKEKKHNEQTPAKTVAKLPTIPVTNDSALEALKKYIETMGGELPANWSAKVARRADGHLYAIYFDPNGKRLRSKPEVARSLNVFVAQ